MNYFFQYAVSNIYCMFNPRNIIAITGIYFRPLQFQITIAG